MNKKQITSLFLIGTLVTSNFSSASLPFNVFSKEVRAGTESLVKVPHIQMGAKASSEQIPASGASDGGATWAIDNNGDGTPNTTTIWHARYQGSLQAGEDPMKTMPQKLTLDLNKNDKTMEAGAVQSFMVKEVEITNRSNNTNRINDYELQIARADAPTDSDFRTVKSGQLGENQVNSIVLDKPVEATHVRIVSKTIIGGTAGLTCVANVEVKYDSAMVAANNAELYSCSYFDGASKYNINVNNTDMDYVVNLPEGVRGSDVILTPLPVSISAASTITMEYDVDGNAKYMVHIKNGTATKNYSFTFKQQAFKKIPKTQMTASANTEQNPASNNDGPAAYAIDDNLNTLWHAQYNNNGATVTPAFPHILTLDLNGKQENKDTTYPINTVKIHTRQDGVDKMKQYKLYTSTDGVNYTLQTEGTAPDQLVNTIQFQTVEARYVKLEIYTLYSTSNKYSNVAEIEIGETVSGVTANAMIIGSSEQGTVTVDKKIVPIGGSVVFTATPSETMKFVGWYENETGSGEAVSTDARYTKALDSNTLLYAKFQAKTISEVVEITRTTVEKYKNFVTADSFTEASYGVYSEALVAAEAQIQTPGSLNEVYTAKVNLDNAYHQLVMYKVIEFKTLPAVLDQRYVEFIKKFDQYSISFSFKIKDNNTNKQNFLMCLQEANSTATTDKMKFFVNPSNGTAGILNYLSANESGWKFSNIMTNQVFKEKIWHTLTFTNDNTKFYTPIDGNGKEYSIPASQSGRMKGKSWIDNVNQIKIGGDGAEATSYFDGMRVIISGTNMASIHTKPATAEEKGVLNNLISECKGIPYPTEALTTGITSAEVVAASETVTYTDIMNEVEKLKVLKTAEPAKSTDASLTTLKYKLGALEGVAVEGFNSSTETYHVLLPEGTTGQVVLEGVVNQEHAKMVVTPATITANRGTAKVVVTAEDGITTKTYTVNFTVAEAPKSTDATLSTLKYKVGTDTAVAVPSFVAGTTTYAVNLPAGTAGAVTLEGTKNFGAATMVVTGGTISNRQATARIVVTAEDGVTTKTYTVNFTVAEAPKSTDATLTGLKYKVGNNAAVAVLNFVGGTTSYTVNLLAGTTGMVTLEGTKSFTGASMVITPGTINANKGSAQIKVTAEDGVTIKTYTVNFVVQAQPSELPTTGMSVTAGNQDSREPAGNVLDGNPATIWNTSWDGSPRNQHYITLDMGKVYDINNIHATPRSNAGDQWANGVITKYEIQVSMDGKAYTTVSRGPWENKTGVKNAAIAALIPARYVRLISLESYTDTAGKEYSSLAELKIVGKVHEVVVDKTTAIGKTFEAVIPKGNYTDESYSAYTASISALNTIIANTNATQDDVNLAVTNYTNAKGALKENVVVDVPATGVNLNVQSATLEIGETITLTATVAPENATNKVVTWISSDNKIATVIDGVVTAVSPGSATITATINGHKATCAVTVNKAVIVDNKVELKAKLEVARGYEKDKYTEKSFAKLEAAMEAASIVINNAEATEADINNAVMEITAAISQLELKPEDPKPVRNGWIKEGNKERYYINDKVIANTWVRNENKWLYAGDEGYKAHGWIKVKGVWYYLDKINGIMQTGWLKEGKTWYLLAPSGRMLTGWQREGKTWYLLTSSGRMLTGWQKQGSTWYLLAPSGRMLTGWQKQGSTWYYLASSGRMEIGWVKVSNKWYYLSNSGMMQTGWQLIKGKWYYLKSSGEMATGWIKDGAKEYYLTPATGAWNHQVR